MRELPLRWLCAWAALLRELLLAAECLTLTSIRQPCGG